MSQCLYSDVAEMPDSSGCGVLAHAAVVHLCWELPHTVRAALRSASEVSASCLFPIKFSVCEDALCAMQAVFALINPQSSRDAAALGGARRGVAD